MTATYPAHRLARAIRPFRVAVPTVHALVTPRHERRVGHIRVASIGSRGLGVGRGGCAVGATCHVGSGARRGDMVVGRGGSRVNLAGGDHCDGAGDDLGGGGTRKGKSGKYGVHVGRLRQLIVVTGSE